MTTCLITGCEGFVGSHLADFLIERGMDVVGMTYGDRSNLAHLEGRMRMVQCDLRSQAAVEQMVTEARPDYIFHLAAQSFVGVSWDNPEDTLVTNVLGSFYLLEAVRKLGIDPTVLVVGSSSLLGPCEPGDMPLGELREFRPTSMYAVSKVAEEMLGYFYAKTRNIRAIRVRPFNMTGPRKLDDACADFAKGIAEIEQGKRSVLPVGNLETVRDFTDGRDAVLALWTLAEKGAPGDVYNLCSGRGYQMREVLDKYIEVCGHDVPWEFDPARLRPFDDPIYIGDNVKLRALGWEPTRSFETTLRDTLDYWRERVRSES